MAHWDRGRDRGRGRLCSGCSHCRGAGSIPGPAHSELRIQHCHSCHSSSCGLGIVTAWISDLFPGPETSICRGVAKNRQKKKKKRRLDHKKIMQMPLCRKFDCPEVPKAHKEAMGRALQSRAPEELTDNSWHQ